MSPPNPFSNEDVKAPESGSSSMLLDLPTEIFTIIISNTILEAGLTEAWRLREVCKTFRTYIEDEILTNTPLHKFVQKDNTWKIIEKNLEKCLLKRCLSGPTNLATNSLPLFLVELTETLLKDFPPQHAAQNMAELHFNYVSDLVHTIVRKDPAQIVWFYSEMWGIGMGVFEWAKVFDMSGKANPTEALKLSHLVIAAAAVGNTDALKVYLEKDPEAAFAELFDEHWPLQLAVASDNLDMATFLLDEFQSILKKQPEWYTRDVTKTISSYRRYEDKVFRHLEYAMDEAIDGKNAGMLQLLLDFEFKYYDYASTRFSEVMLAIVKSGSLDLVKVVAGSERKDVGPDWLDYNSPWWEEACLGDNGGNPQMVRYLLETGVATTGEPRGSHQNYGHETPLHWIAKSGKGDIAKILIEFGANVNYRFRLGRPTPLKTAAYFGNIEAAQVLIDAGANVHLEYPLTAVFNCKRREREKIFDTTEMLSTTELLLKHGKSITYRDAFAIEQEAKGLVISGYRWLDGDLDRESVMALVSVAKRLMETVPRWRIPYADFYIRSKEARELFDAQWFERISGRYSSKRGSAPCWPDMYFLSRVLRNVGYGNLRKLIPRKRKYLIADARRVLCWLEDWRV